MTEAAAHRRRVRALRTILLLAIPGAAQAQGTVPVAQEPRHHAQLENAVVRLFDVVVPVGDTTFYHVHSNDYTYVSVGAAALTAQVLNAEPAPLNLRDGEVRFSRPVTHRVSNHGNAPFHNLTIELLSRRESAGALPTLAAGDSVVLDNERVRVVRSVIAADEVRKVASDERTLLAFLSSGELHLIGGDKPVTISAMPGVFHWVGDARPRQIHNAATGPVVMLAFTAK